MKKESLINIGDSDLSKFCEVVVFDEDGLIPAVITNAIDGVVLMVGYMNKESIYETLERKQIVLFSRSRCQLWHKGSTSGDYLNVTSMQVDCDGDCLLFAVHPVNGRACHTGRKSCFYRIFEKNRWIEQS